MSIRPVTDQRQARLGGMGPITTSTNPRMLSDHPRLFFMHIWANDKVEKLARGLRDALDKVNSGRS